MKIRVSALLYYSHLTNVIQLNYLYGSGQRHTPALRRNLTLPHQPVDFWNMSKLRDLYYCTVSHVSYYPNFFHSVHNLFAKNTKYVISVNKCKKMDAIKYYYSEHFPYVKPKYFESF
jgi:hypothetical protein